MSSDSPQVVVLLAAYNGMAWIAEQLASIQAQVNVSVSIYISVDPSTDGTEQWCADYAQRHCNVHLLPPAGPFKGAAPNFFRLIRDVDLSPYNYVAFSDQDDIWHAEKLDRAVQTLRSGSADGYSSNVTAFWPDGRRVLVNKAQPQVKWDYLFEAAGPGCTYVLKPDLATAFKALIVGDWERVQRVSLHDWFCYAFARSRGFRWFIDPVPGMEYRQHANNQIGVNAGRASAMTRWARIADGWWFNQIRLTSSILGIERLRFLQDASLSRVSLLRIGCMAPLCRRRLRDQMALFVICVVKAVTGH